MSYATKANMISAFGEDEVIALTDRSNAFVIDDAVLAAALAEADAEIDPYLAGHYVLPPASVPAVLVGKACDITRYRLSGAGVTETDIVRMRYTDAIKFLDKVAAGKLPLALDALGGVPVATGGVKFSGGVRTFDRNTLADFNQ